MAKETKLTVDAVLLMAELASVRLLVRELLIQHYSMLPNPLEAMDEDTKEMLVATIGASLPQQIDPSLSKRFAAALSATIGRTLSEARVALEKRQTGKRP